MPPKAAAKPKQKDIVVKDPKKVDEEQVIVYGVTTCISVKRALALLKSQSIEYTFHDLKKEGLPLEQAENWIHKFGPEKMLRLSAFKKKLSNEVIEKAKSDPKCALSLMVDDVSIVSRPIVEHKGDIVIGFKEQEILDLFK